MKINLVSYSVYLFSALLLYKSLIGIGRKPVKTVSTSALIKHKSPIKSKASFESSSTMALADKKIANLTKEIKKLKDEQLQLLEATESYKNQVSFKFIRLYLFIY